MAIRAPRPCRKAGCKALSRDGSGRCPDHPLERVKRESSSARGYGHKWQKARLLYLQQFPFCNHCKAKGIYTAATDIDHIKPHQGDQLLFWTVSNWQPLCKQCHSAKTAREDGGFGNARDITEAYIRRGVGG